MTCRPLLPLCLLLLLGACAPSASGPAAETEAISDVAVPTQADSAAGEIVERPLLQVELIDGGSWDLAEHRGRWVVVNFWATWCKPCLKEIPDLSAFHDAREDVEVIGLAYEDIEPEDMRAFLGRHPASYPIAILDTYAPPEDFETPRGLPLTWLIAPDGSVARKFLGPVTSEDLAEAIASQGPAG